MSGNRLSKTLGLSRIYDWSSVSISEDALILKVLAGECFEDLTKVAVQFGLDRVATLFQNSKLNNPIHRQIVERMLGNIKIGVEHAA